MAIIRWSPVLSSPRALAGLHDDVDRLFDGFFTRFPSHGDTSPTFIPSVDIQESADEFLIRVDLPGVNQKDVKVSLLGDTLILRGERTQETTQKDASVHRVERQYGSFQRSFTLGTAVRGDKVKANYRDGVLEISVPKAEEARLKEIEVQVG